MPQYNLENSIAEIIDVERSSQQKDESVFGNVLITSISKKVPLINAVKKAALKISERIKVFGSDVDKNCIGNFFVDGFWNMPYLKDIKAEDVIDYCKSKNVRLIIPTRDGELSFFAKNKSVFAQNNIDVLIPTIYGVNICLDKYLFGEFGKENNLPFIETALNIDGVAAEKYVVKERFGAGSLSIGINLNKEQAILHGKTLENPIFQPYVSGQEYSVDCYMDNKGNVKGVVARKRVLVINGESQITQTVNDPKLESLFYNVVKKMNLTGHSVFQALVDNNGEIQVIECNCRFGGASTLAIAAGLDTFYWAMLEAMGNDISDYPFIKSEKQITQVRFAEDFYI